jgi:hypothetical protein
VCKSNVSMVRRRVVQVQLRRLKTKKEQELEQNAHTPVDIRLEPAPGVDIETDRALTEADGSCNETVIFNEQYNVESSSCATIDVNELIRSGDQPPPLALNELQHLLNEHFSQWIYTNEYDEAEEAIS